MGTGEGILFWVALGPLATAVMGYLPGRRLGLGADIPKGVYWQWRRWCLSHGFHIRDHGRTLPMPNWYRMRGAIRFVAVEDDADVPPSVVWRLMQWYPAAAKRQKVLKPRDYGLHGIGHIGAFARRNAVVWPSILEDADRA